MRIKFYGYKNCSTCKKAQRWLESRGLSFEDLDITETPPKKGEIEKMIAAYDGEVKKLFNTSGQAYREAGLGKKLPDMSRAEAVSLLAGNGRLVKRPFLVVDGTPKAVGFKEDVWKSLF